MLKIEKDQPNIKISSYIPLMGLLFKIVHLLIFLFVVQLNL